MYFQGGKEFDIVCKGNGYECDCTTITIDGFGMSAGEDTVYAPTLSELIEACGDNFWALYKARFAEYTWQAHSSSDQWDTEISHGTTPEEAVAKLWLTLNKN